MISRNTKTVSDSTVNHEDTYRDLLNGKLLECFSNGLSFTDIIVTTQTNLDGEDYLHAYIVFEGDINTLDPAKTLSISTALWLDAKEMGYSAIPIQSFVEKSEWLAANR